MVTLLLENIIFRDRNASEAIDIFSIYIYHITANPALRGHLLNKVKANPALRGHILNKVKANPALRGHLLNKVKANPALKGHLLNKVKPNPTLRGHILNKVKANPALRGHILNKVNVEFYHIILCCAQSERYLRFDSYLCGVSDICFPL